MNQIEPLGYITKDDRDRTGAEPTTRTVRYSAKRKPYRSPKVVVAVIDTGLSKQSRNDGWLSGISVGRNDVDRSSRRTSRRGRTASESSTCAPPRDVSSPDRAASRATRHHSRTPGRSRERHRLRPRRGDRHAAGGRCGAQTSNLSLGTEMPHDVPPWPRCRLGDHRGALPQRSQAGFVCRGGRGQQRQQPSGVPGRLQQRVERAGSGRRRRWSLGRLRPTRLLESRLLGDCSTARSACCRHSSKDAKPSRSTLSIPISGAIPTPGGLVGHLLAARRSAVRSRAVPGDQGEASEAVAWLLSQGPSLPDFGTSLEILPAR